MWTLISPVRMEEAAGVRGMTCGIVSGSDWAVNVEMALNFGFH